MRLYRCITILLLSLLPWVAQAISTIDLNHTIQQIHQANCLDSSQTAIRVVSVPQGRVIYSYNETVPLLPASTMKIVTTAAALHFLGPEYRFKTRTYHDGERINNVIQGNLYLRGGGDPKLTTEQLWLLVRKIKHSGIDQIQGNIIIDSHFFDSLDRAPTWKAQRSQRAYDAKLAALAVNYNVFAVHIQPNQHHGDALRVWIEPQLPYMQVLNKTKTIKRGRNTVRAWRNQNNNQTQITVQGKLPLKAYERTIFINVANPVRYAASLFQQLLQEADIRVTGHTQVGTVPNDAAGLYTHESPPLSLILKELNLYSSNFMAEQILKTIAAKTSGQGSHTNGLYLVKQFLIQLGVQLQNIHLADGSGLSYDNRFTALAMTDVLSKTYTRFDLGPDFVASLRVMGAKNSHSKRLKTSPARTKIRAKTGTLRNVSALAGYVSNQRGQLFAYAFFLNNHRCGYHGADRIEDAILTALYEVVNQ